MARALIPPGDADPHVARGFDRLAPVYDVLTRVFPGDVIRRAAESLLPEVPRGSRVLVVGGGTGRVLPALLLRDPEEVVWIDPSAAMIARARRRIRNDRRVRFRTGGLERLEDDARAYDVIATPFVLDLWYGDRLDTVVRRLAARLEPGGLWLHADFASGRGGIVVRGLYAFFRATCAIEARAVGDWEETFGKAGLAQVARRDLAGGRIVAEALRPRPDVPVRPDRAAAASRA